ncbi:hypothetical protein ThimaDRAFT_4889, partial [Thiocapsa marina 5811]
DPGATWTSQRDHLLLTMLYNTGARVSEIIAVRVADVVLEASACVHLHGKGRGKCQGSCRILHVMFVSAFSWSRGGFPGLSKTEAGGVQLRVGPDQRVGLSSLAAR